MPQPEARLDASTPSVSTAHPTRRCFIHAGLPKTGTSYLQSVFWNSRDALSQQGFELLPQRRQDHLNLALCVRNIVGSFDDPFVRGAPQRLTRQLARSTATTVLVTQEALAPTTTEQAGVLLELLDGFDVHVVVTARDLARQVPSAWQQRIQARLSDMEEEFYAAVRDRAPGSADFWANQDLTAVTARWAAAVGPDHVHVVTCPPAGTDTLVLFGRFCSVVGVDPGTLDTTAPTDNVALGRAQAELQRRVNVALGDRFPHSRAGYLRLGQSYLAGKVLGRQRGERARLPESLRPWVDEVTADWLQQLGTEGYDVVGDLADLQPTADAFDTSPAPVTDAELVEVAATALADILEIRDRELDEAAATRRELDELREKGSSTPQRPAPGRWAPNRVAGGVRRRAHRAWRSLSRR
ncbi:MAG: hypothetical protein M3130_08750 [Actinomycetota bacterium]|nr:hypothetical protein [Actinomycetota bacterium]